MIAFDGLLRRLQPTTLRGKRIAAALLMLGIAALTSVSIFATGPTAEPEQRREKSWPVSVIEAEPRTANPSFTAYGRVESNNVANIATDLVAEVDAVHVREGDWVARGDVLIELSRGEVALQLAEREAELAENQAKLRSIESEQAALERTLEQSRSMQRIAKDKLSRHQDLLDARLISRSLFDEVLAQANQAAIDMENHQQRLADLPNRIAAQRAVVDRSRALADRARLELEKTAVRAPFSGPVLAVNVAPGNRSALGLSLVEMASAEGFEIRVQVPEVYEVRLQHHLDTQQPVRAALADGRNLDLTRLSRRVRPGQSALDAFFRLAADQPGTVPPIGRVVDMRIDLPEEAGVVALPIASLYENDRIYAVKDNRLQAINVERVGELHTADGEYRVLVRSPELGAGRPVITTQLPKAVSGLLVEPS